MFCAGFAGLILSWACVFRFLVALHFGFPLLWPGFGLFELVFTCVVICLLSLVYLCRFGFEGLVLFGMLWIVVFGDLRFVVCFWAVIIRKFRGFGGFLGFDFRM